MLRINVDTCLKSVQLRTNNCEECARHLNCFFSVVAYPHRTQLVACRYVYIFKPGSCKFIHVYTTSFELKDTSKSSNLRFWPRQWRQWQYCPAMAERISELWHNCGNDQCNGKGANSKLPRRNRSHMVSRSCPSSICSRKLL